MTISAIRLDPTDNVVSLLRDHAAGNTPEFEGGTAPPLLTAIKLGHKVALEPIATGDAVRKFGARIGHATADIAPGAHVHLHNLRGDIA